MCVAEPLGDLHICQQIVVRFNEHLHSQVDEWSHESVTIADLDAGHTKKLIALCATHYTL